MTDPTLERRQRRAKLEGAIASLLKRYEELFKEPAKPRLQKWLEDKVEAEKDNTLKASLSHFEPSEILDLLAIVKEPEPQVEVKVLATQGMTITEPPHVTQARASLKMEPERPPDMIAFGDVLRKRGRPKK